MSLIGKGVESHQIDRPRRNAKKENEDCFVKTEEKIEPTLMKNCTQRCQVLGGRFGQIGFEIRTNSDLPFLSQFYY